MAGKDEIEVDEVVEETVEEVETIEEPQADSAASELDQLRHLVFGAAKADIEVRLSQLQDEMRAGFEQAEQNLRRQMTEMQSALKENIEAMEDRITWVDSQHDDKTADLSAYADKLAAEIEMNDAASKQQDDELHKRLDGEIQQLTDKFTQQHDHTIELLNQVKRELNTSKTDRKTLARLLATVATNLETDGDS